MNFHFPRLHFGPSYTEILAGIRDQLIEQGTAIRFMEAYRPVPHPRAADGRFVSKREIVRQQLVDATRDLAPWQRDAAILRASKRKG